jgi:hypothetical protein
MLPSHVVPAAAPRQALTFTLLLLAGSVGCSPEAPPPPPGNVGGSGGSGGSAGAPAPRPQPDPPPLPPIDSAPAPIPPEADAGPPTEPPPAPPGPPSPSPDAGPPPPAADGGAADGAPPAGGVVILPGVRTSLNPDLLPRWTGARRMLLMENGTQVFRGLYQANQFGGAAGNNVRLKIRPGREYIFEYRIRFDGNFPFSRGGKIPGLGGGTAPTGCVTTTGAGFSARMMWREGGALIGYVYDNDQSTECGNALPTGFRFQPNQWHAIKERIRLNTGRNRDGIMQVSVDGRMVLDSSNRAFMNESPTGRVDVVLFHSFFGGSSADWAPSRDCTISFADLYVTLVAE